jgi:hypothetical protein
VFSLRHRGEELLPSLPDLLGEETIFGITADEIRRIGALPLKYFSLTRAAPPAVRRAGFLIGLKDDLNREIDAGQAPPPSLHKRSFDWYRDAVVPALVAIFSDNPRPLVVNVPDSDGVVREAPASVSRHGVEARAAVPPAHVEQWLRPWEEHERAVLQAIAAPSLASVEHALSLDPIVPRHRVRQIARDIWVNHEQ